MNKFTKKSIEIANSGNYYDQLQNILNFPLNLPPNREVDDDALKKLEQCYVDKDSENLLKQLRNFKKFPIKHPLWKFLDKDDKLIELNPEVSKLLSNILFNEFEFLELIESISQPPEINQQLGNLFQNFLVSTDFGIEKINYDELNNSNLHTDYLLIGTDAELLLAAETYTGYKRTGEESKGLDFFCFINNTFVIGEHKFCGDYGGNQDKSIKDGIHHINAKTDPDKKVNKICLFDGVMWLERNNQMHRTITENELKDQDVFSTIFLKDYLNEVK
tara:strand:+ start:124 stop:948 length:825 start_codon:yes stop_codon:yes gene_type:complete